MTKQPLLFCTICFILGIFGQDFFQWSGWIVGLGLGLSLILLSLGFIKQLFFDRLKSIFLLSFFVAVGCFCHFLNFQKPELPKFTKNQLQNITFQLTKKLNSNDRNKRYEVEILNFEQPFLAIISIPKEQKELDYQHYYSAEAYLNPTQKPQHDYQFDYQQYLARQNIYFQGFIPNEINAKIKSKILFSDQIKQYRLDLLQKIEKSTLKPENQALLKGIILADRTEIDRDTIQDFSQTGLIHILAISGTHMAIIFMLILSVAKPFFSVRYRHFPIYFSLFCIWLFALFIGFGNSVVRSCLMISIYYIMIFLQRKPSILHAIGLSALIILIIDTQQVFNIGFQLSFLAVLGISSFHRTIIKLFDKPKNIAIKWIINTFSLTLSAQMTVLPLTIFYFHQFSPLSIFFNIPALAIAQIFIISSFLISIFFGFNIAFDSLLTIYDNLATLFLKMVHFFADVDFSFIPQLSLSWIEMGILFGVLYFLKKVLSQFSPKNILYLWGLIFVFVGVRMLINFYFWQNTEILEHQYFKQNAISIKQGEQCIFLISKNSDLEKIKNYMITPYLTHNRINQIEIKILNQNTKVKIGGKIYEIK